MTVVFSISWMKLIRCPLFHEGIDGRAMPRVHYTFVEKFQIHFRMNTIWIMKRKIGTWKISVARACIAAAMQTGPFPRWRMRLSSVAVECPTLRQIKIVHEIKIRFFFASASIRNADVLWPRKKAKVTRCAHASPRVCVCVSVWRSSSRRLSLSLSSHVIFVPIRAQLVKLRPLSKYAEVWINAHSNVIIIPPHWVLIALPIRETIRTSYIISSFQISVCVYAYACSDLIVGLFQ